MEKEVATHSRILAWKISWTEESGGVQSMGSKESDTTEHMDHMLSLWNKMGFFLNHFNQKTNILLGRTLAVFWKIPQ